MVSFAYDKWLISGLHLGIPNPLKSRSLYNPFKSLAKTSTTIINKVGDKWPPYFNPLEDWNKPNDCLFIKTEYQLMLTNLATMSMILWKPNFLQNIYQKNSWRSIICFSLSSLITRLCSLCLLLISMIISWATRTFYVILFVLQNLIDLEIIIGKTATILSYTNLEILFAKCLKLVG